MTKTFEQILADVNPYHAGDMGTEEALVLAYNALEVCFPALGKGTKPFQAKAVIAALLAQQDCEHLEGTGSLTDLCDVVMFG